MTSSILTKSFTNQVKRSSSSSISFSNFGGFLQQTFNSISNNFVNARPTMESSFQNAYLIFSNIRRRIEDLRYSFTKSALCSLPTLHYLPKYVKYIQASTEL